ncbi:MAG TPA: hypothetical protein VLT33_02955 [Labilithrix sp.]|nr:hypothetical protein [Labilithrix sp.]
MVASLLFLVALAGAFAAGWRLAPRLGLLLARRRARRLPAEAPAEPEPEPEPEPRPAGALATAAPGVVRFDALVPRGTRSAILDEHTTEWRSAMREIGARLRGRDVTAVVFAHGSFVGGDPTSALAAATHALPRGRVLAKVLRKRTRTVVDRMLGDFGNFGPAYVRLFEQAIGGTVPCTSFAWSSENHHLGRLEGALDLLRVLATHAELGAPRGRILVLGHSHAGQVFALLTQLLSRSLAAEAIVDVARARALDVGALEVDRDALDACSLDFVTLGAPARYAWASLPNMRSLHIVHGGRGAAEPLRQRIVGDDWVRRLGGGGSDFPAIAPADRRVNAALDGALGAGFAPSALLRAVRADPTVPTHGELVLVDYGSDGLSSLLSTGLGHGVYTRLDGMLFHASLVASRLYG